MTQEIDQDEPRSLEIVFAEVKDRLNTQSEQIKTLDGKAGLVLSSSSVIITIGAGLRAALGELGPGESTLPSTAIFGFSLFVLAAVLYLATMIFALRAYSPRSYRRDPGPTALRELYIFEDPTFTKRRILANVIQSFEENKKRIRDHKLRNLHIALVLLMAETIALVAAFILPPFLVVLTPSLRRCIILVLGYLSRL